MTRYVIDPDDEWENITRYVDDDELFSRFGVTIELRGLIDTRTGAKYPQGARRVKCAGMPTTVFKGETAWSRAQALARDYAWKVRRG